VFYSLLKAYSRLAIKIWCRRIRINKPEWLREKGPLLLASNHPNSFLDGMIMSTLLEEAVYSLARGDAFKNKRADRFLRRLRLLPVFRTSEGPENLEQNYTTFASCLEVFRKNGIVLIFSEGRCENEWQLRALKKGTARLAISAWNSNIPLTVVPLGINYSSFKRFGKEVHIHFGRPFSKEIIDGDEVYGKQLNAFNSELYAQLPGLVYQFSLDDNIQRRAHFPPRHSSFARILLLLPAAAGFLLHLPLYLPVKAFTHLRFVHSAHYDSILVSLLLFLYPLYIAAFVIIAWTFLSAWALAALVILPFTAWSFVQVRE
jgi:1-acyl-sn-glycerol-3-phosphate acyltransferase